MPHGMPTTLTINTTTMTNARSVDPMRGRRFAHASCMAWAAERSPRGAARYAAIIAFTAIMVGVFNALPFVTAIVTGMLLLLALTVLPLWLFSALMTLTFALLVPLTATAQTMLYGDAVAEQQEQQQEQETTEAASLAGRA
jgi:hypothetical protein